MSSRRVPILIALLIAGLVLPVFHPGSECCASPADEVEQPVAASCGGCCSVDDPGESHPEGHQDQDRNQDDEPGGCQCVFCSCCKSQPVICRAVPSLTLIARVGTPVSDRPIQCLPREAADDLLRPPQA